ncbi:MAG: mercury resistance system transport protein MerF [Pirellulaceae bacterium]|jgi:mercuric ion transport protein|nr:mercury resistance system transport protein MerF [Pirellulaceae bacterium]
MTSRELLRFGITGTVLTGICCFTPFLITILSVFGVLAWLSWTDFVLLPLFAGFLLLTLYSIERIRREPAATDRDGEDPTSS